MSDTNANRWDWKAMCAAILLACYLGFAIWALFSPSDDPQRGMAIGLLFRRPDSSTASCRRAVVRGRRGLCGRSVIAIIPRLQMSEMIYHLLSHAGAEQYY
jgi:hypothetical protein